MKGEDGPPYPEARRVYRMLGIIHAPLFGAMLAVPAIQDGYLVAGIIAGIVAGLLTLGVFWRLAEDHYQGNVSGKPGELYPGQKGREPEIESEEP